MSSIRQATKPTPSLSAFLSVGFRPFFCLGILFCALSMGLWGAYWSQDIDVSNIQPFGGFLFWHGHEFIMGFALAIVFGFLLTAVQNWTGLKTTTPFTLGLLITSWLVARAAMLFGNELPDALLLILTISPNLAGAFMIAKPIVKTKLWRNLFAPVALIMMALIDVALIFSVINNQAFPSGLFLSAIFFIALLITMIGGRVIPMFTANNLGIKKVNEPKMVFLLSVIPLPFLILLQLINVPFDMLPVLNGISSFFCLILTMAHGIRLFLWFHKGILLQPMLWSLWLFYACLPIGFLVLALKPIYPGLGSIALHIITIGGISGLTSSMVSRVSLGHTGREITHDNWIVIAFALIVTSLLIRTLVVSLLGISPTVISASALLFSLAFAILFIRFLKVWSSPRH